MKQFNGSNLSIKKRDGATGEIFNFGNHEFLLNGKEIDGKRLTDIQINLKAGEMPVLTLEYRLNELEIEGLTVDLSIKNRKKE